MQYRYRLSPYLSEFSEYGNSAILFQLIILEHLLNKLLILLDKPEFIITTIICKQYASIGQDINLYLAGAIVHKLYTYRSLYIYIPVYI